MNNINENIKLSLPINAAYVSAARLTASSIANRMSFDVNEVEDIKAAVSEACTFFIKNFSVSTKNDLTIIFSLNKKTLKIEIGTNLNLKTDILEDEMSLVMIKALMDDINIDNSKDKKFKITMIKTHKEISFD